jgi:hypothetical protein
MGRIKSKGTLVGFSCLDERMTRSVTKLNGVAAKNPQIWILGGQSDELVDLSHDVSRGAALSPHSAPDGINLVI